MTHVVTRDGFEAASIAEVITYAGVSRPTFYDYFADKDACFLAAIADVRDRLLADVDRALSEDEEHPAKAAVAAVVGFADSQSTMAQLLINHALAAGPAALDARDRGIAEIASLIEEINTRMPATASLPDISSEVLIGAVFRLLSPRLRRPESELPGLLDDVVAWIASYELPLSGHRWRSLEPVAVTPPASPLAPLIEPPALPRGRPSLPKAQVEEIQRQRILFAAARASAKQGYAATTIGEITDLAHIDTRTFHRLFKGKQDVYLAVRELHFQHLMAVTANAFFKGATWPERVWEGANVFGQCVEQNPVLAHAAFVETYAGGPVALQRAEELLTAFTIFLQEGYQYQPGVEAAPSPTALQAIAASNFEIIYRQLRGSASPQLAGLLPHATFLCLAPFLGVEHANKLIDVQLGLAT